MRSIWLKFESSPQRAVSAATSCAGPLAGGYFAGVVVAGVVVAAVEVVFGAL